MAAAAQHQERWEQNSMLILASKAKTTDFLDVLIPFSSNKNPWTIESTGPSSRRLALDDKEVLVSGTSQDGPLVVSGQCGVVSRHKGADETYALIEGTELGRKGQLLISSSLKTEVWKGRYEPTMNALVSLKDKKASFDLKPWPGDAGLLLNPPRANPGQEPTALLLTAVTFRLDAKPSRMLIFHGYSPELKFDDPLAEAKTNWQNDYLAPFYKRQSLEFSYDPLTSTVTILLEPGEHQVIWQ